jgi:hypothetical protein
MMSARLTELARESADAAQDVHDLLFEYIDAVAQSGSGVRRDPVSVFRELADAIDGARHATREALNEAERRAR